MCSGQSGLSPVWDTVCMQAAGFGNSLVPFASAILGRPLMKTVCAWTGGRAAGELPSGLVAAFPFPFHCSVRLLSSTLVFFSPVTFPPWWPGSLVGDCPAASPQHSCGGSVQYRLVSDLKQLSAFLLVFFGRLLVHRP